MWGGDFWDGVSNVIFYAAVGASVFQLVVTLTVLLALIIRLLW